MIKKIVVWIPPLACMLFIFYLSSQSRFTATGEPIEDFLIFKILHMIEYGVLTGLLFNALFNSVTRNMSRAIRYAGVIAVLYALSDELHQMYVPTRSGTLRDVGIDTIGICIALYLISKVATRSNRR